MLAIAKFFVLALVNIAHRCVSPGTLNSSVAAEVEELLPKIQEFKIRSKQY